MQITNNNLYNNYSQGYSLGDNSLKETQESQDFGTMLNKEVQTEETQNIAETQTQKVEPKTYGEYLMFNFGDASLEERSMIIAADFIADYRETMRIQGIIDISQIDHNLLSQVRKQRSNESDPEKIQEMLEQDLAILQNPYSIQRGSYMGGAEDPAHFEARKNAAIDYLSEILQEIKA